MKSFSKLSFLVAAVLASGTAVAYEPGNWIVRTGAVMVDPSGDSSSLNLAGAGDLPGTGVSVDDDTQLLLNITYMFSSHVGVELLAATPFEHSVRTTGLGGLGIPGVNDVDLGTIKHLPPTLSVLWYPLAASSRFQPFIGGGVNYTVIYDEQLSGEAQSVLGADNLDLDNSAGLAFRTGFDYMLNDCWSLHAGAYYLGISTDASLNTALGKVDVKVDVDPWVYTLGIGRTF